MPQGQARLGDLVLCGKKKIGVWATGSLNTLTNVRPSVRLGGDIYI